ncbi:MAG: hypothetical protein H0X33_08830 [Taibaiella sp.]|nr:hypothetical protein [Taibaiella sp.]
MKRIFFLAFILIHFSVIIYNNIIIEEHVITKYLYNNKSNGRALNVLNNIPFLSGVFTFYSQYTGTGMGYGFYAPNVSSQVVLMLTKIDDKGNVIAIEPPKFYSKDANIRYNKALDIFLNKIDNHDSVYNRYMNLILKSIVIWTMDKDPRCKNVVADLLIYDLPVKKVKANIHPHYLKLGHYVFSSKEYISKI